MDPAPRSDAPDASPSPSSSAGSGASIAWACAGGRTSLSAGSTSRSAPDARSAWSGPTARASRPCSASSPASTARPRAPRGCSAPRRRRAPRGERLAFLPDGDPFPPELKLARPHDGGASPRPPRRGGAAARGESLEAVDLADRARTRLAAYSRGMHRRFGLAQAFLGAPDLVLLDEPTAGLDAPGFDALARLLGAARDCGATVVLASHVPSDLIEHCDEAVLLVGGAIEARGRSGAPWRRRPHRDRDPRRLRGGGARARRSRRRASMWPRRPGAPLPRRSVPRLGSEPVSAGPLAALRSPRRAPRGDRRGRGGGGAALFEGSNPGWTRYRRRSR